MGEKQTLDGDYIKREAQEGRMGQILYAVALKRKGGFDFRAPTAEDFETVESAEKELARLRPRWEADGVIPTEPIGVSNYDRGHRLYGMEYWSEMFAPRHLLSNGTYVDVLKEMESEIREEYDADRAEAVLAYLAFAVSKVVSYNANSASWHVSRNVIRGVFDSHNYAMKWTFTEFDGASNLLPWAVGQVADAYRGIAKLTPSTKANLNTSETSGGTLTLRQGSAADLSGIPDASVHAVVTDPPYYDNVQYAELADFFYVWLKRTAGHLYPEWYGANLTNKDDEAVANPARFADLGRKKGQLADRDYERKMADAFREAHSVLVPHGVLTVMFTHKRVEAWDTLAHRPHPRRVHRRELVARPHRERALAPPGQKRTPPRAPSSSPARKRGPEGEHRLVGRHPGGRAPHRPRDGRRARSLWRLRRRPLTSPPSAPSSPPSPSAGPS